MLFRSDAAGMRTTADHVATLQAEAEGWFTEEDIEPAQRDLRLSFDMRYVGQNYELNVALDGVPQRFDDADLKQRFFDVHEMNYGYFNPDDPVEIVNFRLTARGRLPRPEPAPADETHAPAAPVEIGGGAIAEDATRRRTRILGFAEAEVATQAVTSVATRASGQDLVVGDARSSIKRARGSQSV